MSNFMKDFFLTLPTDIHYGPGVMAQLKNLLASQGISKVLVVTDNGIIKAGLMDPLVAPLTEITTLHDPRKPPGCVSHCL